jgi:Asp-tRNA(Asn)/Glu-tRNA(Gln) amidotransferase A subunit family amidase
MPIELALDHVGPMTATVADNARMLGVIARRGRAPRCSANCIPTNLSGHPALSIPCGIDDGLPVGLMLIGRQWDEATIYRAADAFERAADWRSL